MEAKKKIELVEEKSWDGEVWYSVTIDGRYHRGSSDKEKAAKMYQLLLANHRALEPKKTVLKSEEV